MPLVVGMYLVAEMVGTDDVPAFDESEPLVPRFDPVADDVLHGAAEVVECGAEPVAFGLAVGPQQRRHYDDRDLGMALADDVEKCGCVRAHLIGRVRNSLPAV